ncbi:MAG TPA: hypothetical protein VHC47_00010 [Mucilaginibacter sp.]|nr:hypothetical protein [Mucilaginibacter sp.]
MKRRIYKLSLLAIAMLTAGQLRAQDTTMSRDEQGTMEMKSSDCNRDITVMNIDLGITKRDLKVAMADLHSSLKEGLSDLHNSLKVLGPQLKDIGNDISTNFDDNKSDQLVQDGDISEKVKNYSKTYPMDANDHLSVENKFGKVTVNTWAKNEVKVDVEIKVYAGDDGTAQKMLDAISISDSKDGDAVSFHTNFGSSNSMWGLFNNMNDRHKAEVNYTIYMPANNGLNIDNRYGSTEVPDFNGKVSIECAYGSFDGGAMMHPGNQIEVRYGSAHIDGLSSGDVNVNYGSLDLGSVDKFNGEIRYSSAHIGRIRNSANIDAHYAGSIKVDNLDKNFSNFSSSSNYSSIKIGLDNSTNADFDITVRYGGFDYSDLPIEITEKTPSDDSKGWKPTKNYKGHIGKGSSDRTINISASYGGVKFE